jgi:suppressor of G2 allele of SKP1
MSANIIAAEGVKLVGERKYTEGIAKLTKALDDHPAPLWLLERSKAYLRTDDFVHALYDAEKALSIAYQRANRDLMAEAQIRRAIALFRMNRFADADVCAFWAVRLCEGAKASEDDGQQKKVDGNGDYTVKSKAVEDEFAAQSAQKKDAMSTAMGGGERSKDVALKNQAFSWRTQALNRMGSLPAGDPGRKVSVIKCPTPTELPPAEKTEEGKHDEVDDAEEQKSEAKPKIPDAIRASVPFVAPAQTSQTWEDVWKQFTDIHARNNVRTDFYQTDTSLNISFFIKNISKDSLEVDSQEQTVSPLSPHD